MYKTSVGKKPRVKHGASRDRVFKAAVRLIARRGYSGVSVRDIARTARVNLAAVNYHFGGKAGLLRSIIEEFSERYYRALQTAMAGKAPMREAVNSNISAIVGVYRDDIELAIAAEKVLWMDIPEVHAAQIHLHRAHRADLDRWFASMGLDPKDLPRMAVARGLITNLVGAHFTARYHYENIISPATRKTLLGRGVRELTAKYDDDFYEEYCSHLTDLYLAGIEALASPPPARRKPARRRTATRSPRKS